MTVLTCSEWATAKRTRLRHIRPGDLFFFTVPGRGFGSGRIVARVSLGHTAEIFDPITVEPPRQFDPDTLTAHPPVVIDSYSLLDRGREGDYRILAHDSEFDPGGRYDSVFFAFGAGPNRTRVDILGNRTAISEDEARHLPRYTPLGDARIQNLVGT